MDRRSPGELQQHMLDTYDGLRTGLAWIGVSLPILVFLLGCLHRRAVWLGPSISHYYHVGATIPFLTTRDVFVGGLLAAAACLYLYKGFSTRENVALNLAGIFALVVAVVPTAASVDDEGARSKLHGAAAVLFFLCIAYVSIRRSRDTLRLLSPEKRDAYARRYFATGTAMLLSPLAATVLSFLLDMRSPKSRWVFAVEALGIWAFSWYWHTKTREMRESAAESDALEGKLQREVVTTVPPASPRAIDRMIRRVMVPDEPTVERIVPATPPDRGGQAPAQ